MNMDDQMERCQLNYCRRRDFLPFTCSLCQNKYCLEHKDPKDHECQFKEIKTNSFNQTNQENEKNQQSNCKICSECKIKLNELNKVECAKCKKDLCLKHRLPEVHVCKKVNGYCIIM